MTYLEVLKNSPKLIQAGFPDASYWRQTVLEFNTMWRGLKGLLFQAFVLILWLLMVCTCPVSLPLLSLWAFLYRDRVAKKRQAEIDAKIDALHSNQKTSL